MADTLKAYMQRHDTVALQFSAGKDSAACLKLLRPYIEQVIVLWVNPGSPYPETVQYMADVARSVPRFQAVVGRQPAFIYTHGHPADVVPFEATLHGRVATRKAAPLLTSIEHCCGSNLWSPLHAATKATGATGVVRGEKRSDALRSRLEPGAIFDGREFHFPLHEWTDADVIAYLGDELPASYKRGLVSSLDCINCTAYTHHNPGRMADLREHHPEVWEEVRPVLDYLRGAMRSHLAELERES
jgi:phosphoadenosine phosphosulfate reductase